MKYTNLLFIVTIFFCFVDILTIAPNQNELTGKDQRKQMKKERHERRLLQKKRRRLKLLREEIRTLTRRLDPDVSPAPDISPKISERNEKVKIGWRKQFRHNLTHILRRLERLEHTVYANKTANGRRRKVSVAEDLETPSNNNIVTTIYSSTTATTNGARKGDNGSSCQNHNECRPGRCCERSAVTLSDSSGVCVFHSRRVGSACTNSCHCSPSLSCFRFHNETEMASCRRPSISDVREGIYLNDDKLFITETN